MRHQMDHLPSQLGRKIEVLYRGKTSKYARIVDPSNGEAFWYAVLSLPWHESTNHVATEENLNMIGSACIRDTDKALACRGAPIGWDTPSS